MYSMGTHNSCCRHIGNVRMVGENWYCVSYKTVSFDLAEIYCGTEFSSETVDWQLRLRRYVHCFVVKCTIREVIIYVDNPCRIKHLWTPKRLKCWVLQNYFLHTEKNNLVIVNGYICFGWPNYMDDYVY
jgi:hypothetical protein